MRGWKEKLRERGQLENKGLSSRERTMIRLLLVVASPRGERR